MFGIAFAHRHGLFATDDTGVSSSSTMLVWFFTIPLLLLATVYAEEKDLSSHAKRHLPHRLGRSGHRSRHARFASNLTGVSQRSLNRRATLPAGWSVLTASGNDGAGCYEDTGSVRVLSNKFNGYADVGRCLQQCQSAGFQYAGMEYGSECWVRLAHDNTRSKLMSVLILLA